MLRNFEKYQDILRNVKKYQCILRSILGELGRAGESWGGGWGEVEGELGRAWFPNEKHMILIRFGCPGQDPGSQDPVEIFFEGGDQKVKKIKKSNFGSMVFNSN